MNSVTTINPLVANPVVTAINPVETTINPVMRSMITPAVSPLNSLSAGSCTVSCPVSPASPYSVSPGSPYTSSVNALPSSNPSFDSDVQMAQEFITHLSLENSNTPAYSQLCDSSENFHSDRFV